MSNELLLTTERTGEQYNVLMMDLHTGTTVRTFKDDSSLPHSLTIWNNEVVVAAINNKPLIFVWPIESKDRSKSKWILPGIATAMAISNDGNFLVVAIEMKIYIWQLATGDLLSILTLHYQPVRNIGFTDDDSYIITSGDDNVIIVSELNEVVQRDQPPGTIIEPKFTLTGHTLPITDMYISRGGHCARMATVSLDHTCKIWDLLTGQCMATFVNRQSLTAVTMDSVEMYLFLGCKNGEIYRINIHEQQLEKTAHTSLSDPNDVLIGHHQEVTCLGISLDGSLLISGSIDCNVMVWDVDSGQCVRTIVHKGPVTNILVTMTPKSMLSTPKYPTPVMSVKKNLCVDGIDHTITIGGTEEEQLDEGLLSNEELGQYIASMQGSEKIHIEGMQVMQTEMVKLKEVCLNLYESAVNGIVDEQ